MAYIKSLKLTKAQWEKLKERLEQDYPRSVMALRYKMRDVLGFVPREHTDWLGYYDNATEEDRTANRYGYKTCFYLDFYSEPLQTMFLLKYCDYINN